MTVERLVQEHGMARAAIFIAAEGDDNSARVKTVGADAKPGDPSGERCNDAALERAILVTGNLNDYAAISKLRSAFREFDSEPVT